MRKNIRKKSVARRISPRRSRTCPSSLSNDFLGTYGDAIDKRLDDITAQARYARQSGYPRFAVVGAVTAIELITRYMLMPLAGRPVLRGASS
jgi:hypothetical protein